MANRRVNHPSEVVSVGDIVDVYVYEVDEIKHRVQLSLLSLDELAKRDNNKKEKSLKKSKNREYHKQNEEINEEEAMKKLLERFGSKY